MKFVDETVPGAGVDDGRDVGAVPTPASKKNAAFVAGGGASAVSVRTSFGDVTLIGPPKSVVVAVTGPPFGFAYATVNCTSGVISDCTLKIFRPTGLENVSGVRITLPWLSRPMTRIRALVGPFVLSRTGKENAAACEIVVSTMPAIVPPSEIVAELATFSNTLRVTALLPSLLPLTSKV